MRNEPTRHADLVSQLLLGEVNVITPGANVGAEDVMGERLSRLGSYLSHGMSVAYHPVWMAISDHDTDHVIL